MDSNRLSLSTVQKALFVVCLDVLDSKEKRYDESLPEEKQLVEAAKHLLTGGGSTHFGLNRWYDESIQVSLVMHLSPASSRIQPVAVGGAERRSERLLHRTLSCRRHRHHSNGRECHTIRQEKHARQNSQLKSLPLE